VQPRGHPPRVTGAAAGLPTTESSTDPRQLRMDDPDFYETRYEWNEDA
jgi:hypothetical protein